MIGEVLVWTITGAAAVVAFKNLRRDIAAAASEDQRAGLAHLARPAGRSCGALSPVESEGRSASSIGRTVPAERTSTRPAGKAALSARSSEVARGVSAGVRRVGDAPLGAAGQSSAVAAPGGSSPDVRRCRACGCTDDEACDGGCWWVGPDLCSQCDGLS